MRDITDLEFKQANPTTDYGNFPMSHPTNGMPTPYERAITLVNRELCDHTRQINDNPADAFDPADLVLAVLAEYGIDDPTEPLVIRYTADAVVFAQITDIWHVLLIERRWEPYAGRWALPGGHVERRETGAVAAIRELGEETGVHVSGMLPVGAYDSPDRDPRGRYVTAAFATVLDRAVEPKASDDAAKAKWTPVVNALRPGFLAFDHDQIVNDAMHLVNSHRLSGSLPGRTLSGRPI